jgi:hypothetical protein
MLDVKGEVTLQDYSSSQRREMGKFNCAREYRLSKRRYDEAQIFHHDPEPQTSGFGVGTIVLITATVVVGLIMFGFLA